MADRGLSERHALRIVGMSASAYRYQAAPDKTSRYVSRLLRWPIGIAATVLA